ncbi:MAG TPA: hypothetical protein VK458_25290, partial [Myxococcaceae bacterium]|nr:hypothetical protein [Myxococcaceae bacterium]
MSFPRALLTGLLLATLALTGCKRDASKEETPAPEAPKVDSAPFLRAGLTAPTTVPGVRETGAVDLAELREGMADPQSMSAEEVAALVWKERQLREGPSGDGNRPDVPRNREALGAAEPEEREQ